MIKKHRILLLGLLGFLFIFILSGCDMELNEDEKITTESSSKTTSTTTIQDEISPIDTFVEKATGDVFSYELDITTTDSDGSFHYIWKFAQDETRSAYSMYEEDTDTTMTVLYTADFTYLMTEDQESKLAFIYGPESDMVQFEPSIGYFTDFGDDFIFEEKTTNVQVGNVDTTCYEYTYHNVTYRYYVDGNENVIKVEYTDGDSSTIIEINNFKTSNIDTSLFTIPTEEAGYEITDLSQY